MMVHLFAFIYGIAFVLTGIEHFRGPQKFVEIVPSYLPFALFLVYLTGTMEIAGGLGIIYPETREIAGRLMALSGVYNASSSIGTGHYIFCSPPRPMV